MVLMKAVAMAAKMADTTACLWVAPMAVGLDRQTVDMMVVERVAKMVVQTVG